MRAWRDFAPLWEKHRDIMKQMYEPVTSALVEDAQITTGDAVLDVAAVR